MAQEKLQMSTTPESWLFKFTDDDHVKWLKALVSKNTDSGKKCIFSLNEYKEILENSVKRIGF
jgi:hypothetical protein